MRVQGCVGFVFHLHPQNWPQGGEPWCRKSRSAKTNRLKLLSNGSIVRFSKMAYWLKLAAESITRSRASNGRKKKQPRDGAETLTKHNFAHKRFASTCSGDAVVVVPRIIFFRRRLHFLPGPIRLWLNVPGELWKNTNQK